MARLDEFLQVYEGDDNAWWSLQSGDHQALFDALLERHRALEERVAGQAADAHRLDAIEARLDTDADALAVQLARALSEQATLRARLGLLEGRIDGLSSWLAKLAGTVRDMNAPGRLEALEWFREQVEASLFPVTE